MQGMSANFLSFLFMPRLPPSASYCLPFFLSTSYFHLPPCFPTSFPTSFCLLPDFLLSPFFFIFRLPFYSVLFPFILFFCSLFSDFSSSFVLVLPGLHLFLSLLISPFSYSPASCFPRFPPSLNVSCFLFPLSSLFFLLTVFDLLPIPSLFSCFLLPFYFFYSAPCLPSFCFFLFSCSLPSAFLYTLFPYIIFFSFLISFSSLSSLILYLAS